METNNIFTESYDDPIIDDALDNEIDILSTDDATTVDYDEIPDYNALSVDDDNRTVTLERYCEEFKQKLLAALETSVAKPTLYFVDERGNETDIQEIDNLLYFAIWDGEYITPSNIPYDVENNRLMSFKIIKQYLKFKIDLFEYFPSPLYPGREDKIQTRAEAQPTIVEDETNINTYKIISIQDFEDFIELQDYFAAFMQCEPDTECVDEWTCAPEEPCDPHESY